MNPNLSGVTKFRINKKILLVIFYGCKAGGYVIRMEGAWKNTVTHRARLRKMVVRLLSLFVSFPKLSF